MRLNLKCELHYLIKCILQCAPGGAHTLRADDPLHFTPREDPHHVCGGL